MSTAAWNIFHDLKKYIIGLERGQPCNLHSEVVVKPASSIDNNAAKNFFSNPPDRAIILLYYATIDKKEIGYYEHKIEALYERMCCKHKFLPATGPETPKE